MIQRLKDFALYKFKSKNKFGIHSPFIFEFVTKVLYEDGEYYCYQLIEKIRKHWLSSSSKLKVIDLGAGSKKFKTDYRKIKEIFSKFLVIKIRLFHFLKMRLKVNIMRLFIQKIL